VPLGLKCPTIAVVAWEFSTIPDGSWDPGNPREDWRYVFGRLGFAISLSNHTARVVKEAMGADFPIFAVASPVYDRIRRLPIPPSGGVIAECEIAIRGTVFDSRDFELAPEQILEPIFPPPPIRPTAWEIAEAEREREAEAARASAEAAAAAIRGTQRYRLAVTKRYFLEWYREAVRDLLPRPLVRAITRIGGLVETAYRRLAGRQPPPSPSPQPPPLAPEIRVSLGGVVYTSMLNPTDGRKNWGDILTAFCWTFADVEDATLVLKIIKGDPHAYRRDLFLILARQAPFKCRVVTMDGFLEDADYAALMGATSFYVNASNAEGMCMPLTEFMSVGKPVIAPCHTAMADYIDPSAAFVLGSTPEHNVWPNDPRPLYTTMREKLKWDTLTAAFEESYRIAKQAPERYAAMGANAEKIMRDYCSDDAVRERLRHIMGQVVAAGRREAAVEEPAGLPAPRRAAAETT
jgi:glycosyltransferase involved in cell wall biosynthesis